MKSAISLQLFAFSLLSYGAVSSVQVGDPARQQGVVRFRVNDPAQCSLTVYKDASLTQKVDDTNNSVFAGSENCARAYNVIDGKLVTAVIGRRTSEMASDGTLHSRSLEVSQTYYVMIVDATDNGVAKTTFTTDNIPWGDTHVEDVPYNSQGFGRMGYPDLDWSDAGLNTSYVDPLSGVSFKRVVRNIYGGGGMYNDGANAVFNFTAAFDVSSSWTNASNAVNGSTSGPFASTSSTNAMFLPFRPDTPVSDQFQPAGWAFEDAKINLFGSGTGGTAEDRKVLACLALAYAPSTNQCTSAEIELTLQSSVAEVDGPASYPSYRFAGWSFPRFPDSEKITVPHGNNSSCVGSAVTLTDGMLPTFAASGMKINIGNNWYTIGTITNATTFTLSEANVNASGSWWMGITGIRVRKKTATGTVSLGASYSVAHSPVPELPANGQRDYCSSLTIPVNYEADGTTPINPPKTGRLCMNGSRSVQYLFLLLDDGETRYLSPLQHGDSSWQGISMSLPLGSFSLTDPYSLIALHTDDSGTAGAPERINRAFYKVTYDAATCHFKAWPGNAYKTGPWISDCVNWVNQTPYSQGKSVDQQQAAALAANPIWDSSWKQNFGLSGFSGKYAVLVDMLSTQDNPCIISVFDMTNFTFVKLFDSFSGSMPGFKWGGCHSFGMDLADRLGSSSFAFSILYSRTNTGYLSGPWAMQGPTAKSLDGGVTWTSDTSLNPGTLIDFSTSAGKCGAVPTMIGSKCVDATNTAGLCSPAAQAMGISGMQCAFFKVPSEQPCNTTASSSESTKRPCTWHSGWSSFMNWDVGDYFARMNADGGVNGKMEKFRILSKTSDGSGGWKIEVQRWSLCDNITSDFATGAIMYSDHLYTGQSNNTHPNGWQYGYISPTKACGGANTWVDLGSPLAQTNVRVDSTEVPGGHNTIGISPDGQHRTQVGYGVSRTGDYPDVSGKLPEYRFNPDWSMFAGIPRQAGGQVEQYPSLSNWMAPTIQRRSLYWDWRHLNPDLGTVPEDIIRIWNHTYTLVSGQQNTYKMDIYQDLQNHKQRRPNVFSTRWAFYDISGPGSVIDDTKLGAYCYAYKAGECRPGSAVNDLYVVTKNAHLGLGGCITDTYRAYAPCAAPLWSNAGWMIEGDSQRDDPLGYRFRRITMGLTPPSAQYQYTSPHMTPDSKFALVRPGWHNGMHPDFLAVKMPPPATTDNIDRTDYVLIPVSLPAGSGYARVRFGYAENGAMGAFYCTTRQEACLTDGAITPFAFEQTDTLTAKDCRNGCTIPVPALSGRVMYYRVEKSANGSTGWVSGITQVKAVK